MFRNLWSLFLGFLSLRLFRNTLSPALSLSGLSETAAPESNSCTQRQLVFLHGFPDGRMHGLVACFHLLPFRSAANLWLPGRPVIT